MATLIFAMGFDLDALRNPPSWTGPNKPQSAGAASRPSDLARPRATERKHPGADSSTWTRTRAPGRGPDELTRTWRAHLDNSTRAPGAHLDDGTP